jgi:Ca2+-binding EF-hand superfamily protein
MARHLISIAGLAAILAAGPAIAQVPDGETPSAPAAAAPRIVRKPTAPPAHRRIDGPAAPSAGGASSVQSKPSAPVAMRPGQPSNVSGLAGALAPDLHSSIGIPKTIFVQRFVAESLNRFDRDNRLSFTSEQLNQSVSSMEKTVREGAYRWWNEADRTKSGRIGRDDAQAASVDQFRKLTGLRADQTETKQQSGIRESFERGAAQQFSRYDVDGDGFVVRQEVDRRIAEEIERIERSARIARALVEDGSHGRKGFLDRDKATLLLSNVFDTLDANHDGTLSSDEIPNSLKRVALAPAPAPAAVRAAPIHSTPAAAPASAVAPAPAAAAPAAAAPAPVRQTVAKPRPPAAPKAPTAAAATTGPTAGADQAAAPAPTAPRPQAARPRPAAPAPARTHSTAQRTAPDANPFAQPLPSVRDFPVRQRAQPRPAEAAAQ